MSLLFLLCLAVARLTAAARDVYNEYAYITADTVWLESITEALYDAEHIHGRRRTPPTAASERYYLTTTYHFPPYPNNIGIVRRVMISRRTFGSGESLVNLFRRS